MAKSRIIIADTDISYILPLQLKFAEEFFEKIDMEIITEKGYCEQMFSKPQTADVLIVSEELYNVSLQRHNIGHVFLMTEQDGDDQTGDLNVERIYKYTSIKEILNEIVIKSAEALRPTAGAHKNAQIVLVYSASGGVGKTTVAMGISACLTKNYKRVLYINAGRLQSFQCMLDNHSHITSADVYPKVASPTESIYSDIRHVIRRELFSYLPPFKASLLSLGLPYGIYEKIALGAKRSGDYDYIILDADATFDEESARLLDLADRVLLVTTQHEAAVCATNALVSNINGAGSDKYMFICNDFDKSRDSALISPNVAMRFTVSEYVEHFAHCDQLRPADLSKAGGMQRTAFLIL